MTTASRRLSTASNIVKVAAQTGIVLPPSSTVSDLRNTMGFHASDSKSGSETANGQSPSQLYSLHLSAIGRFSNAIGRGAQLCFALSIGFGLFQLWH